jgi:cytoskeletal protein RodZ
MAAVVSDDSGKGHGSPARTQKDDGMGIGETLRIARERRGLTLEQVSRETKIPLRHLDALEHDNPAALPGPFYQRAQIRTYARALKLDPNLLLAPLERSATPPATPAALPSIEKTERPRRHVALIATGVVLTALVLWRTMPRSAALDGSTQLGRDAGSIAPGRTPSEEAVTPDEGGLHRTELDQTPQPSAAPETVTPIAIQPTATRPEDETPGAPAAAAKPADERRPVPIATELIVASEPAGARVTIDGIGWGITPVTIRHLPPGSKRIRVSKEGYAAAERVVSVVEGQRKTTDIALSSAP